MSALATRKIAIKVLGYSVKEIGSRSTAQTAKDRNEL